VWKNRIVSFIIGLALGILGTIGAVFILDGQSGPSGGLAEIDRANQQRTAETVAGLERTVEEQRGRIGELEANNRELRASTIRLTERIGNARGIVEQLAISTGTTATDIQSAIELHTTITDQVKSLDGVLGRGDTGSDSRDGMDHMENL
jgi:hypothetical protein